MESLARVKALCGRFARWTSQISENMIPKRERVKGQRDRISKAFRKTFREAALLHSPHSLLKPSVR